MFYSHKSKSMIWVSENILWQEIIMELHSVNVLQAQVWEPSMAKYNYGAPLNECFYLRYLQWGFFHFELLQSCKLDICNFCDTNLRYLQCLRNLWYLRWWKKFCDICNICDICEVCNIYDICNICNGVFKICDICDICSGVCSSLNFFSHVS